MESVACRVKSNSEENGIDEMKMDRVEHEKKIQQRY